MGEKEDVIKFQKQVGLKIRSIRMEKGWTLEQTEERGYPSWRHLQKVEAGKNMTLATIFRIAKVLKVSPKDLLNFP